MNENVLIGIRGLHTADEGSNDDIEVIFPGTCRRMGDTWYARYNEPVEGSTEMIRNLIKFSEGHMEVTKKGLTSTHMVFEEGKKNLTWYETPLGSVSLGIAATSVRVSYNKEKLSAQAVYALDVNEEHMADCMIEVSITERSSQDVNAGMPIGVFDSGVGGISVLRALVKEMPNEDFIYIGDSANAPYGTRSKEEVCELTLRHAEVLRREGVKALVIACNTATSAAIATLRETYTDIPVIGIEPALKPAALIKPDPVVLVMATPATVSGEKFIRQLHRFENAAKIIPVGCPGLMEFVERGEIRSPAVKQLIKQLLEPYLTPLPDAIVLGCTHYPFLTDVIREVVGEGPAILDGGEGTARHTRHLLEEGGMLAGRQRPGRIDFQMTLPGMEPLCRRLLHEPA